MAIIESVASPSSVGIWGLDLCGKENGKRRVGGELRRTDAHDTDQSDGFSRHLGREGGEGAEVGGGGGEEESARISSSSFVPRRPLLDSPFAVVARSSTGSGRETHWGRSIRKDLHAST